MSTSTTFIGLKNSTSIGTTLAIPAYNQASGHAIVVGIALSSANSISSVQDTAGNLYTLVNGEPLFAEQGSCTIPIRFYVAQNCAANAANVITVTCASTVSYSAAMAWDISGAAKFLPVSNVIDAVATSASPVTGTFSTASVSSSILMMTANQSGGYSTGSTPVIMGIGATEDGNAGQGGNEFYGGHLDVAALCTGTAGCTQSVSHSYQIAAIVVCADYGTGAYPVQNATMTPTAGANASSFSVAFPANNVAGNLLVVRTGWYWNSTGTGSPTIGDTQGNTWVALTLLNNTYQCQVWYCLSAKAGANTVTVTFSGNYAEYGSMSVAEWQNTGAVPWVFDGETHGTGTPPSAVSVVTTLAGDVVFSYGNGTSVNPNLSGTGWATRSYGLNETNYGIFQDTKQAAAGSISYTPVTGLRTAGIVAFGLQAEAASPTFTPNTCNQAGACAVTATSTTAGSTIYYTTDGSAPVVGSSPSVATGGTINVTAGTNLVIRAIAHKSGFADSTEGDSGTYTINGAVTAATFTPASGVYLTPQTVSVGNPDHALPGFAMYYNFTGSPDTSDTPLFYSGSTPPTVSVPATATLYVLSKATNYADTTTNNAYVIGVSISGNCGVPGATITYT